MNKEITQNPLFKKSLSIVIYIALLFGFSLIGKIIGGLVSGLGKFFNIYLLGKWFGENLSKTYVFTYMISFIVFLIAVAIYIAARKGQYADAERYKAWETDKRGFIISNSIIYTAMCAVPMAYFFYIPDRLVRGEFINSTLPFFFSPQLFLYYITQNPLLGFILNLVIFLVFSNLLFYKKIKVR